MEKKLEQGISFIRNFAEKYKETILERLNPKTVKTINKKKKMKKTKYIFKNGEKKRSKSYKEEKMRKLDNYLISQEKALDIQENYTIFNKFNTQSNNLFYNSIDNKVSTCLKKNKFEGKNDEKNCTTINDNFLDSLNSLEFKIKQEIQENNDLLSLQRLKELSQNSKELSKGKKYLSLKRIPHSNDDARGTFIKTKNLNKEQLDDRNTKKQKKTYNFEYEKTCNYYKKCNSNPKNEIKKNSECKNRNEIIFTKCENRDKEKKTEEIDMLINVTSRKVTDDILFNSNELSLGDGKNALVFGKNKFENIKKIFQNVLIENKHDKNNKKEIYECSISNNFDNFISYNKINKQNEDTNNNILNKTNQMHIDECSNEYINNQDNTLMNFEQNDNNNNNNNNGNENTVDNIQANTSKINVEGIKSSHKGKDSEEFNNLFNGTPPMKEDNCFDLFFNEPLATPSIFHM
ncbi:hypothetical protein MKS88_005795 [Plasmodium brasilianum]|uniref:Uncharacterized protein n=2 Tax=Plasmodium (Plasmodium) TaxID=418103 RepID=A0A1A8WNX9_PLAMA|nr:conserved Plasmodium protein, unknown function [Plasmodium malariae]KAI4835111.1 hypothetical protein MKS88_005795 [Plasmodium brasilianum]SBS93565.1 hypothetical protein, conserved [Plasmodium malariae]SCP03687.1 conserved Plasmodium protein, unknown function [Plasmodium malariae]